MSNADFLRYVQDLRKLPCILLIFIRCPNPIAIQLALTDQDKQHSIHQQAQTGELEKQIMEF